VDEAFKNEVADSTKSRGYLLAEAARRKVSMVSIPSPVSTFIS